MKKLTISLMALTLACTTSQAGNVTPQQVRQYAQKAMQHYVAASFDSEIRSVEAITRGQKAMIHVVNFEPEGWVLLSADDEVMPVLGYSDTGYFSLDDIPDNANAWLSEYCDQIDYIMNHSTGYQHRGWSDIEEPKRVTRAGKAVDPLIQVNWNQSGAYQKYCPIDSDGKRAIVGCVAVGMGQAMSVCQFPTRPVGSFSYKSANYGTIYVNYDAEPDYDWNAIMTGANNKDEVARLLYHCGVSVSMDYGPTGSGSHENKIPAALKRNFQYPNSVELYYRDGISDRDWEALIQNELYAGRAVIYCGADENRTSGHCFNIDGYNGDVNYHVNWGWGGHGNGYFPLSKLYDAKQGIDFTSDHSIVIGVRPPTDAPTNIFLSNKTVCEGMPAGTVVGDISIESEAENPIYEYQLKGPINLLTRRNMPARMDVVNGQLVTTGSFSRAEDGDDNGLWEVTITATNKNNNKSITRTFQIEILDAAAIKTASTNAANSYNTSYNMMGLQVSKSYKGLVIKNGKKYFNQ